MSSDSFFVLVFAPAVWRRQKRREKRASFGWREREEEVKKHIQGERLLTTVTNDTVLGNFVLPFLGYLSLITSPSLATSQTNRELCVQTSQRCQL